MKKTSLFALLAVAGSTSAFATVRETASFAGPIDTVGLVGNPGNPVLTFTATGTWDDAGTPTAYSVQQLVFNGTITNVAAGNLINDASILVTPPSGTPFIISPRQGGTSPSPQTNAVTIPVGSVGTAGNWTFQFFELWDDATSVSTAVDSSFSNVTIGFDDAAPASNAQPGSQANFALSNILSDGTASAGFVTTGFSVSGSSNNVLQVRISGTATSLAGPAANTTASAVSNLRFAIVNPAGVVSATVTPTFTGIGITNANAPSSANFVATINLPAAVSENGTWTLRSFQATDIPGGADVGMRDVMVSLLPPPPPPTTAGNFGVLPSNGAWVTLTDTLTVAGETKWFQVNVPAEISTALSSALDIDTVGSSLTPSNDTNIGLYTAAGALEDSDNDDSQDLLSQLSYGRGSRQPTGNGAIFGGGDGTLLAGTYYLAVRGGTSTFGAPFNPTGAAANTGPISVRARYFSNFVPVAPTAETITLVANTNVSDTEVVTAPQSVKWYTFTTTNFIGAVTNSGLRIHSEGSVTTPANDTAIIVYNADGSARTTDTLDGTDSLASISYGVDAGAAPGNGLAYNGRDGGLPAGTYYVATVAGTGSTANAGFVVSAISGTASATVLTTNFELRSPSVDTSSFVAPATVVDMGDVGTLTAGTEKVTDSTVVTFTTDGITRWFKFSIGTDALPGNGFYVDVDTNNTSPSTPQLTGNVADTQIGAFTNAGLFIASDDDDGVDQRSALSFGSTVARPVIGNAVAGNGRDGVLTAGTYWVGVNTFSTTYSTGVAGWTSTVSSNAATGAGDRILTVRTNVPFVPVQCGLSDVAGANQSIGADNQLTADDIIVFLGWYFANDVRADVAGPNQSIGADGSFTADDIIVFLGRYFAGC